MKFLSSTLIFTCLSCALLIANTANAHGRWIVPSHTILSGQVPEVVSVDMSISNDLFHPDVAYGGEPVLPRPAPKVDPKDPQSVINAKRMAGMKAQFSKTQVHAYFPDGSKKTDYKLIDLGRKSASAVLLDQSGTYRLEVDQPPVMVTLYKTKDGQKAREFGLLSAVRSWLPEGANSIKSLRVTNRVMTFVTRNETSHTVLKPAKTGLDIEYFEHPNELFVGEHFKGRLLFDGRPVTNGHLKLIKNDTRYRNNRNATELTTNANGEFSTIWTESGIFLLEAEHTAPSSKSSQVDIDLHAVYVTLEVNPE